MTAYTTIANTTIDAESPVTVSLMTALRDNCIAITEGASGAPRNVQGALSTATATISGSSSGSVDIVMNSYAFFPRIDAANFTVEGLSITATGSGADSPGFRLVSAGTGSDPYSVDYRYISAT